MNQKKFSEFSNNDAKGDIQDLIFNVFNLSKSRLSQVANNASFNNQIIRRTIIKELLSNISFDKIIETGTFLGNTTEFFSKYGKEVYSVEISELYYIFSKTRFLNHNNINLVNSNSLEFLENLSPSKESVFFYLDAHSVSRSLPLSKELEICSKFENSIILVDDFKVPSNKEFQYDSYNGLDLSVENFEILNNFDLYFPNYSPDEEEGSRGYVLIDVSGNHRAIFNKISNLKLYEITK